MTTETIPNADHDPQQLIAAAAALVANAIRRSPQSRAVPLTGATTLVGHVVEQLDVNSDWQPDLPEMTGDQLLWRALGRLADAGSPLPDDDPDDMQETAYLLADVQACLRTYAALTDAQG